MKVDTERVWLRFGDGLRAFVARRVPAPEVDDVVQDVMLRIHRGIGGLRDESRVVGWVYRVARSAIVDHHRRRRLSEPLSNEPLSNEAAPIEPRDVATMVARWLVPLLQQLQDEQRQALELVELEGLSQRALADRLGLSLSGARARVQRARRALRAKLEACCAISLDVRGRVVDADAGDCCPQVP